MQQQLPAVRRRAVLAAGGVVALVACTPGDEPPPREVMPGARRPAYHLTPPAHWMNDPQRPLFSDGQWHLYYLYNADFPLGNGTAWARAVSDDMVTWRSVGVAIPKYVDAWGDIESGSAVVDARGTAGFGAGAVVALATQQADGLQRQSLFVSRDGGRTFVPAPGNPVLDNPGTADFRDPKVIHDAVGERWVMVLAEGHRLGFYASTDLQEWSYLSDFTTSDLGLLECPDLFEMCLDGDPDKRVWVLLASANGTAEGRTTGTVYWTGTWADDVFVPDGHPHRWLDAGPDYYATVTWSDPRESGDAQRARRYALAWLNGWAYAAERSAAEWQGGSQSVVREIELVGHLDDAPVLASRPLPALDGLMSDAPPTDPSRPGTSSFHVDVDIEGATAGVEITLRGDAAALVLRADPGAREIGVRRIPAEGPPDDAWELEHLSRVPDGGSMSRWGMWVDAGSVEVFLEDGSLSFSTSVDLGDPATVTLEHAGVTAATVRALSP
jgi:levanase